MPNDICNLCGAKVALGHPCMSCLEKKRIKENDIVLTADEVLKRISILNLQENDILVVKTEKYSKELESVLEDVAENLHSSNKIMYVPDDTEFVIIRSPEDKDGKKS